MSDPHSPPQKALPVPAKQRYRRRDSFAGGFISGMLDDRLNSDIAEPIQLGVLAAKGRMRSFDYENPYLNIQKLTDAFFEAL